MRKRKADELRENPCDKPGVLAKRGKSAPSELDLNAPGDPKYFIGIPFWPVPGTSPGFSLTQTDPSTLAKIMESMSKVQHAHGQSPSRHLTEPSRE
jgi:hypothetical protein